MVVVCAKGAVVCATGAVVYVKGQLPEVVEGRRNGGGGGRCTDTVVLPVSFP